MSLLSISSTHQLLIYKRRPLSFNYESVIGYNELFLGKFTHTKLVKKVRQIKYSIHPQTESWLNQ